MQAALPQNRGQPFAGAVRISQNNPITRRRADGGFSNRFLPAKFVDPVAYSAGRAVLAKSNLRQSQVFNLHGNAAVFADQAQIETQFGVFGLSRFEDRRAQRAVSWVRLKANSTDAFRYVLLLAVNAALGRLHGGGSRLQRGIDQNRMYAITARLGGGGIVQNELRHRLPGPTRNLRDRAEMFAVFEALQSHGLIMRRTGYGLGEAGT